VTGTVPESSADLREEVEALRREVAELRARLAEAEALADTDALTGLLNRRAFVRELTRAIALLKRQGGAATVLFFDLDGFKAVNDRLGHAAGDAALKVVAERLAKGVRASDLVGRLGGDEFGVVLAGAGAPAAAAKADALVQSLAGTAIPCGGTTVAVNATWGYCELGPASGAEQAISDADAAMYARKTARARLSGSTPAG